MSRDFTAEKNTPDYLTRSTGPRVRGFCPQNEIWQVARTLTENRRNMWNCVISTFAGFVILSLQQVSSQLAVKFWRKLHKLWQQCRWMVTDVEIMSKGNRRHQYITERTETRHLHAADSVLSDYPKNTFWVLLTYVSDSFTK